MRTDSRDYARGDSYMHWHNGTTCHGHPTLEGCAEMAVANGWTGKVLQREDSYSLEGGAVKCYSLISAGFDHYEKFGRFVAEVKLVVVPIV